MSQAACRRSFTLALVLLALLCFGAVRPTAARAVADVGASNVFTLPVPAGQKWYASSSGDVVVWGEKARTGITGYDRSTKQLFSVPVPAEDESPTRPRIFGKWIVFQADDRKSGNIHIFGYDRSTDTTFAVTTNKGDQGNYEMSGDTVVWVSPNESDDSDIFGKNLSTGETFTVTAAPGCQAMPDIAGDWVVYSDFSGPHGDDVKAYNITTKTTKTLCGWAGDQYFARISDTGFVVWQSVSDPKHPDSSMDLYGCNVVDGDIRKIAGGARAQGSPTIGGSLIVYFDSAKPGGYGLVGYDLLSGTRFGISKASGSDYYIAGIQDGTIARLYTDYDRPPYRTTVQLVWPTELDVISDGSAIDESVATGDEGIQGEESASAPASLRFTSLLAAAAPLDSSVSTVVVSAVTDWPSSAMACSLAGRRSPMLLTNTATVPASVLAKLATLAPKHVVVVGGPSSVSDFAFGQLQSVVGTDAVTRVAGSGAESRSLGIAATVASRAGWNGTVLIASQGSASSALVAVPAAVWKGLPIVIADSNGLSTAQIAGLVSSGAKKFVVVGSSVPAGTVGRLRKAVGTANVKTIAGTTVASTSTKFAAWAVASCGMSWNRLAIASNSNWSHTLTAALSQGRAGSALLLSSPKSLSSPVKSALVAHHRAILRLSFVGKKEIVSTAVRRQVRLAIK